MTYDQWKTRTPWDDAEEDRVDEELDHESLCAAFDDALARDEVAPGFHAYGPYVVRVFENGDCDLVGTVVLPSRVGWEPVF